ncbi:CheR family methyltransferase [Parendozoicomonas haliclonae]|uniref:protein-glutamate O-methyltransferase n=1 Tax=Parendozoicomonas haliclonae TaxID=1960125 RepID=A0A1X7AJN0_9GAMM|nr:CheR family methyltransferase [Parendozoicomonas haliclonae]SMA46090.1 Chemotaxis protein methyltransferase [Parendozoicomonas haliclonae]
MSMPTWITERLPDMTRSQFDRWQQLFEERTGNHIGWGHRSILQAGVVRRMRELGINEHDSYLELVNRPSSNMEWARLIEYLTVRETRFFRHLPSYDTAQEFIASLLASDRTRPIEAWSVGCSTGEETWSMAMLLSQMVSRQDRVIPFTVTGTDISLEALAHARRGVYSNSRLFGLDTALTDRFFQSVGSREVSICPRLKERVCFTRVNVLNLDRAPMGNMDLIFCQNLLIYFRRWRRITIIEQLVERLAPGGLLVLGPGEISQWSHPDLEPVGCEQVLAFRKKAQTAREKLLNSFSAMKAREE